MLTRYWFRFANFRQFSPLALGCGITVKDQEDAITILRERVFSNPNESPEIVEVVPNVDISRLDQGHVIPNMESPLLRGVWFPRGF